MQISVRLEDSLANKLASIAKETKRTKSFYVKEALERYIEDFEDYKDAMKAIKEMEEGAPTYTIEEMAQRYGIKL